MERIILIGWVIALATACSTPYSPNGKMEKCYVISELVSDWDSSEAVCQLLGGHLTSISDKTENDVINQYVLASEFPDDSEFFIGLSSPNGVWQWSDGSTFNYTNFPLHIGSEAGLVGALLSFKFDREEGKWDVEPGQSPYTIFPFICQVPPCQQKTNELNVRSVNDTKHLKFSTLDNTYYFGHSKNKLSFSLASDQCKKIGGTLPAPNSGFDTQVLIQMAQELLSTQTESIFIDLTFSNGKWRWPDGTSPTFTNWAPGAPGSTSDAVVMDISRGLWYTTSKHSQFLCAIPYNVTTCSN